MDKITSAKNPMVQRLRALRSAKARREQGLFLVEGEVMIREALSCGLKMCELAADEGAAGFAQELAESGLRAALVSRTLLESICETRTPQGVCASFEMPAQAAFEALPDRIVALDGVQDPGNVGTIWRTADAAAFRRCCWALEAPIRFRRRCSARPWARAFACRIAARMISPYRCARLPDAAGGSSFQICMARTFTPGRSRGSGSCW